MRSKIVAVAMTAVLVVFGGPAWAAATTYYVGTTGNDSTTCGPAIAPCKTISFALGKTAPGDTVLVGAGSYAECVVVQPATGTGGVTLETQAFSASGSSGAALIDGKNVCDSASALPGPVVTVFDGSSFSGFAVKDGGDGGVVGLGAVRITNNVISASTTTSVGGGIFVYTGTFLTDPLGKTVIDQNSVDSNTAQDDGAGIFVSSLGVNGIPSVVLITGNLVTNNATIPPLLPPTPPVAGAFGAGISVFTSTGSAADSSSVTITTNTISGNTVKSEPGGAIAYGGGIFVATAAYTGSGLPSTGTENVAVGVKGAGNIVRNNVSEGYGGGISVNLQPVTGSKHSIVVEGNTVTANTGMKGGGGIHAFAIGLDLTASDTASVRVQDNTLAGNHAQGTPSDATDLGGGGLLAQLDSFRTPAGVLTLQVARNTITGNDSSTLGGGSSLLVLANDDPNGDGATSPTDATLSFTNNLVAVNTAHDATTSLARGGGVYALVEAFGGQATAAVDHDFLTVAANATDTGSGGLEWDAVPGADTTASTGSTSLSLTNSIVVSNQAFGVGGGVTPGPGATVDIAYDDAIGNTGADWEAQLGVTPGTTPGVISVPPKLDLTYTPTLCSPTIDAGDPAASAAAEHQPNGGRVNLGHLGGLDTATATFPDVNADGFVDGLDVLALAVSFNATTGGARFLSAADIDKNGTIDGQDLAYIAAFYAQACP